jgi:hypothetical protein
MTGLASVALSGVPINQSGRCRLGERKRQAIGRVNENGGLRVCDQGFTGRQGP